MNNDQIKQEFQSSLDKLGEINYAIAANNKSKQAFTTNIIENLSQINAKVIEIGKYITTLKAELKILQSQTNQNNSKIVDNSKQVDALTAQISQLTEEKTNAINELAQIKQQYADSSTKMQTQINECEAKLRDIISQNEVITQQKNALDEELKKTGVEGTQAAEQLQQLTDNNAKQLQEKDSQLSALQEQNTAQIKQLTEENAKQLQEKVDQLTALQEENNAKIKILQDEIAAKEAALNQQGSEAGEKSNQIQSEIDQLNAANQSKQEMIDTLKNDIIALKSENDDLIKRIISATQAISEATGKLREFENPAAFNQTDLDAKFKEIEVSLQQISNSIQGNSVEINQESGQLLPEQNNNVDKVATRLTPQGRLPLDAQIQINGQNFTLEEIRKQLAEKKRTVSKSNPTGAKKYADALSAIQMAASQEDVIKGLQSNSVVIKNGAVMGGKKTKKIRKQKNRKQKGGYTYKSNAKRRNLTTSSMRNPSITSSMRNPTITSSRRNSARGRGHTKRR
jgi:chromosome segregation ATPase